MITVLDVENSTTLKSKGKIDMSPYNPNNKLVSVGYCNISVTLGGDEHDFISHEEYVFFFHNELLHPFNSAANTLKLQHMLSHTTLLVGHNIKYDLAWLQESGFTYDGKVYDTKIGEFVLLRGLKYPTDLLSVSIRRGCQPKKSDLTKDYLKKGIGFEAMPIEIVEEYGRGDVYTTAEIYLDQLRQYSIDSNSGLINTRDMMNEFCVVLTGMERNGICIDLEALADVKLEYEVEQADLQRSLGELTAHVMGDTPINLASPEQLSSVIYSRKIKDKSQWVKTFNIGLDARGKKLRKPNMSKDKFVKTVKSQTTVLRKTRAFQCSTCKGSGRTFKVKMDGTKYKVGNHCVDCGGGGLIYRDLQQIAGLKMTPDGSGDVSIGGFVTDKTSLTALLHQARRKNNDIAIEFLRAIMRLNAIDTYLSTYVGGIERGVQADRILHPRFNQTVASTARLSSSDPNFQNQPRGLTFPVRRTIISRFNGGSILEGDYAQLEFREAGELSGCPAVKDAIEEDVDVHSATAKIMTDAGQLTNRQDAKAHTFKPLYGGSFGTMAEMVYYKAFLTDMYPGVAEWHKKLIDEVCRYKVLTLPTGRQYAFPDVERTKWGCTFATQIKNYPVQGFATADIVPIANILMAKSMKQKKVKSLLINTVHDSLVVDVYPTEERLMSQLMAKAMLDVVHELKFRYNITLVIPLAVELKLGPNWLDQKEILTADTKGGISYTEEHERLVA